MSKTWQFQENEPFIERASQPWANEPGYDYEEGWRTHIHYDGKPCTVTWFPDRMGLQVETPGADDFGEEKGYDAGMFGLTLIKLMLSGADCMQEI